MELKKENELLIRAVYKRNAIWNKHNFNYSNQKAVTKLWEEISTEINFPIEVIKRKWRSLRDCYKVEIKKIEKYSHNNLILKSNWHYFNMLSFLKDEINCEGFKTSNIENDNTSMIESENKLDIFFNSRDLDFENINFFRDEIYENKENIDDPIELLIDTTVPEPAFSNDSISTPVNFRKTKSYSETNFLQIKKQRLNLQEENKLSKASKQNESEAFFASLIPHMGNMAPEQKLLCRIELQKIVYNYAYSIDSDFLNQTFLNQYLK